MKRAQAVERFLGRTKSAKFTIKRIQEWSENQTVTQNAEKFGISFHAALSFKRRYGMKCARYNR